MQDLIKVNMLESETDEMDILNYEEENLDISPAPSPAVSNKSKICTVKGKSQLPSLSS